MINEEKLKYLLPPVITLLKNIKEELEAEGLVPTIDEVIIRLENTINE